MHKDQVQAIVDQAVTMLFASGAAEFKVEVYDFPVNEKDYRGKKLLDVALTRAVPEREQAQCGRPAEGTP